MGSECEEPGLPRSRRDSWRRHAASLAGAQAQPCVDRLVLCLGTRERTFPLPLGKISITATGQRQLANAGAASARVPDHSPAVSTVTGAQSQLGPCSWSPSVRPSQHGLLKPCVLPKEQVKEREPRPPPQPVTPTIPAQHGQQHRLTGPRRAGAP